MMGLRMRMTCNQELKQGLNLTHAQKLAIKSKALALRLALI